MDSPPFIEIEARGLRKMFGEVAAIDDLTFAAPVGQIFGLVGPDGAGKTTTIRMLAGILPPDAGAIRVGDCDVVADPESVKARISYMPQRFGLYEELTVDQNLRFYADLFGVTRRQLAQRSAELLKACSMSDFRQRLARNLSGGMKQKLGLACALIHTPRVLLLDEPTTGVDPVSRREFWAMLYSLLGQGVTVLVSTSYLDEAERCHKLALLHQGRLLICDEPANLKARFSGSVLSVLSPEAELVKARLTGDDGIANAIVVGDSVHLFVDDAARRLPQVRVRLEANSIPYDEIEHQSPTIQDFFVQSLEAAGG
jgi:ABC-2 type transport system ATP-binding protein